MLKRKRVKWNGQVKKKSFISYTRVLREIIMVYILKTSIAKGKRLPKVRT